MLIVPDILLILGKRPLRLLVAILIQIVPLLLLVILLLFGNLNLDILLLLLEILLELSEMLVQILRCANLVGNILHILLEGHSDSLSGCNGNGHSSERVSG